jgi:hypothetical protein
MNKFFCLTYYTPNVGAKVRADITFLPSHLVSLPCIDHDGVCIVDNPSTSAISPNTVVQEIFEEQAQNSEENSSTAHEILEDRVSWLGAKHKDDSGATVDAVQFSVLGSTSTLGLQMDTEGACSMHSPAPDRISCAATRGHTGGACGRATRVTATGGCCRFGGWSGFDCGSMWRRFGGATRGWISYVR